MPAFKPCLLLDLNLKGRSVQGAEQARADRRRDVPGAFGW